MTASAWTDRDGREVDTPEPPPSGSYYGLIGDFQGAAYDRNAFAQGTDQEVAALVELLDLEPGMRVLDVGCGTGRHAGALVARGVDAVGIDLSHGLLRAATDRMPGRWIQADARALPVLSGCTDRVLCLCQGGFGTGGGFRPPAGPAGGDSEVLAELARVLRPGGRLAVTAFHAWFAARFLAADDAVDVGRGVVYSRAEVRGPDDARRHYDLWTTCYTAPHLAGMLEAVGLELEMLSGVEPGQYGRSAPRMTDPELLAVATKPSR